MTVRRVRSAAHVPPGPRVVSRALTVASVLAVAVILAGCGSDRAADGDGSASATTVTTPADPAARDAVRAGASPVVDLPPPPIEGMPQFVGNHGDDLVVAGGVDFDRAGMEIPQDDVAVLDAGTFSWRSYTRPPFENPTGYLTAAVAGDDLVISGFSCEIGTETHDSSGPDCALGPRQTAGLDLDSGRWTRLASPPPPAEQTRPLGPVDADLFTTPTGVLAALPSVRVAVPGTQRAWSFLPNGSEQWVPVDAPPFEKLLDACRAGGAVSVVTVDVTQDGTTWSPKENTGWGSGERYAHLRATTWQDDTRTWSTPTEGLVGGTGVPRLGVSCTATSTVAFTSGQGLPGAAPATDPADVGVFVAAHGGATWVRQAASPPPVFDAGTSLMARTLPTYSVPPVAVLWNLAGTDGVAYDLGTGATTAWPTPTSEIWQPVDASILGRPVLVPRREPSLAAVVLGP